MPASVSNAVISIRKFNYFLSIFKREISNFFYKIFRPTSLDRLSIPSDATGSIKSGQLATPDLTVIISPACHCLTCHRPLYEEEIMAGWNHNSSCMLTRCPWCNKVTLTRTHDINFNVNTEIIVI